MEDKSIIKPILDALEYFNNSADEIYYFYKIIDKFCAYWFNKKIDVKSFNNIEYLLIHDLLGEYIRFEENNKRIALWLLSINRVCYNYTVDLSKDNEELSKINNYEDHDIDATLIKPILDEIIYLEKLHEEAGIKDAGESDIISNYLQWVMVYATIIYPSLNDKFDFYETTIIDAMNFILREFIKQRSNSKRMAYLIMGIKEACKIYSYQKPELSKNFFENYKNNGNIIAGKEEELIKEILTKLKDGKIYQEENDLLFAKITPEHFAQNNYEKLIIDLNFYPKKTISVFNKYIFNFTNKIMEFNKTEKIIFFKTLDEYKLTNIKIQKSDIIDILKKSLENIPEKTKNFINNEIIKLKNNVGKYIDNVVKNMESKDSQLKFNTAKTYIMIFLFKKILSD